MGKDNGWKIVLIDDEADIRDVVTLTLEDAGYEVACAADGVEGLQLCERVQPHIVVTDVRMPRLDGLGVLAELKQTTPEVEVVVATAFGEMDLAIRALQLDASDFITKPINDDALHLALQRARERYRSREKNRDYTRLLEKENALTTQELMRTLSFRNSLIENSIDGILGVDAKGRVVIFNRSLEKMLGFEKQAVIGHMRLAQLFPQEGEADFKTALAEDRFGGRDRLYLYETTLLSAGRQPIPVQVSALILPEQEQSGSLVCFIRDLRTVRRLEREMADQARILHQDKMMSLGRLAASVVHEINNPLSGILNYIRLMLRVVDRGPLAPEAQAKFQRYLQLIESETARCSSIVSGLLTFSRKSPETYDDIEVKRLLDRCVLLSRHKLELSNIALTVTADEAIPNFKGDFNQLQQCVINLIFNAVDAMPDGGTLDIGARYRPDEDKVVITVTDSGSGIAEKDLPLVFEPFFTTKQEGYGVGLGLSTVYGIVKRHNADVGVESQVGQGTTFLLEFPVGQGAGAFSGSGVSPA